MFDRDRDFIADKYHRQDEPFDAFRRMAYHGCCFVNRFLRDFKKFSK